jgi:hypothetical protein
LAVSNFIGREKRDNRSHIGGLRNPLERLHAGRHGLRRAAIMAVVTGSESPSRAIATLPLPYCH